MGTDAEITARASVRPDLEEHYRRHYPRLVGVARRVLGTPGEAEDVVQDVFVSFARSSVPGDQVPGWLAVATAHTALNVLRSGARRRRREELAADDETGPDIADEVVDRDRHERVRAVVARLPRAQGLVVVLRHSGLSYQEISTALRMPVGSVGTTLRRGEQAVRTRWEDHR